MRGWVPCREPAPPGFALVELVVALVILQVGLLATAGMILLAQRNLARAELVMRATLDVRRVADSLGGLPGAGTGELRRPWGTIVWGAAPGPVSGSKVMAVSLSGEDTLALASAWAPPPDSFFWSPKGPGKDGGP